MTAEAGMKRSADPPRRIKFARPKASRGQRRRIPIDQLYEYWIDLSKRPTLTYKDYARFFDRAEVTMAHFDNFYGDGRRYRADPFFQSIKFLPLIRKGALEAEQKEGISNNAYAHMKDVAKKFASRIRKCFGRDIVAAVDRRTPAQDAEAILAQSAKLTYRWAAGIVISNHIANILIKLSSFQGEKYTDDINTLAANLKKRTRDEKLRSFITRGFRRFEAADKLRNRCAHVTQGEPTKQEVEQSISLARLLQRFVR